MKFKKDQRTILIFALSAIALIMVVGFAAFSTSLNINGTANISTNWCVGFDNTKTNTYQITKGKSTGTSPTATMGYDGTACSGSYVPIANLGAVFYQPGDKVEYTLTIANKGSIDAVIESITVDGDSVTSNQVVTKGNIIWKVYMPESTTLQASTGTTTMVVSAEFQNNTDLVSYNAHETQTITVGINAVQSNGSNAMTVTPTFTGTIYAINTNEVHRGNSIAQQVWVETDGDISQGSFATEALCQADIEANGYAQYGVYCMQQGNIIETTYNSCSATGKNVCLRYTIENDIVTGAEACFIKDGTEYCLTGWVDECLSDLNTGTCTFVGTTNIYNANKNILNTAFTEANACTDDGDKYSCYTSSLNVAADLFKSRVGANYNDNWECSVSINGAYCGYEK